jgi:hypothetical protein
MPPGEVEHQIKNLVLWPKECRRKGWLPDAKSGDQGPSFHHEVRRLDGRGSQAYRHGTVQEV